MAKKTRRRQSRSAARAKQTRPAPVAAPDTTASEAPTDAGPAVAETAIHPAAPKPAAQPPATASAVAPDPAVQTTVPDDRRRRRGPLWPFAAVAGLIAAAILGAAILGNFDAEPMASASARPSVVVGIPGGEVVNEATPTPDPTPTQSPDPTPSDPPAEAPADPTPTDAPATPAPTPVPVAAATPAPATPAPAATQAPSTAPPAAVSVASVGSPADAVTAFYRNVTNGNFDAAYASWSDRMKATYSRQENLDDRFANTASIDFSQLYVAEQTATTATVQANFTETYDGGSSRQFVGYWRLIRTERGWLLDEPHY